MLRPVGEAFAIARNTLRMSFKLLIVDDTEYAMSSVD
ncbi:unnamed protein product [Mycetohabitans rhizoxinica HKI 454]|uniref:Uncharacterized protein n=1 Tax=Mycetohabitans rhizoxinica (strain DSM 19002 / CIP 109453 / HKI 454) TaxID=882378 RepID=E5AMB0_MYCRK|nr:unnamed protein product [Mycetohabitans rhizoxinica HKI 454]